MSIRSEEFYYHLANESDNGEIRDLLSVPDFGGDLQIIYTRGERPVESFKLDGEDSIILCCRHTESGELAGIGVCTIYCGIIDGDYRKLAYLNGLRVAEKYRRKTLRLIEAYKLMMDEIKGMGIEHIVTTILSDNLVFQRMMSKRRSELPNYIHISDYRVWVIPVGCPWLPRPKLNIVSGGEIGLAGILDYYDTNCRGHRLYPKLDSSRLKAENFRLVCGEDGEIRASIYINKRSDKRHILHAYGGKYRYLKYFRRLLPLFGYPVLPREGEVLEYEYISYPLAAPGAEDILNQLLISMPKERIGQNYLLLGCTAGDACDKYLGKSLKIHYDSRIYMVDPIKDGLLEEWIEGIESPFLEVSTL